MRKNNNRVETEHNRRSQGQRQRTKKIFPTLARRASPPSPRPKTVLHRQREASVSVNGSQHVGLDLKRTMLKYIQGCWLLSLTCALCNFKTWSKLKGSVVSCWHVSSMNEAPQGLSDFLSLEPRNGTRVHGIHTSCPQTRSPENICKLFKRNIYKFAVCTYTINC